MPLGILHVRRLSLLLLAFALLSEREGWAAAQDTRQICFKFMGPCPAFPEWGGTVDDSDYAYEHMGVAQMDRCILRAKEYHEWCQCSPNDRVIIVHMPSSAWAAYPEFPRQVPITQAMSHTRLWEAAHRFREKPADYAAPKGKFWVDAMPHVSGESGGEIADRQAGEDAARAVGSTPTGRTFPWPSTRSRTATLRSQSLPRLQPLVTSGS